MLDVTSIVIVQPEAGKVGTVRFKAIVPTVRAGLFVTPTHVPPMLVEDTLMFVNVSVKFAFVSADVLGFASVNVMVDVPPMVIVAGLKAFVIVGSPITATVFDPILFVSLPSRTLVFGSTVAVFARLPAAVGFTVKDTVKLPPIPIVTSAPLAVQERVPETIEQITFPELVTPVKFPVAGTP